MISHEASRKRFFRSIARTAPLPISPVATGLRRVSYCGPNRLRFDLPRALTPTGQPAARGGGLLELPRPVAGDRHIADLPAVAAGRFLVATIPR
jgi:hypothetical protein